MYKKTALIIALATALFANQAEARSLKLITSWSESNVMAYLPAAQFKKNLEAMDVGLDVQISGPETVPPFEQITPTSVGVFDMIFTHPAYHDKAITNATNAMSPDTGKMRSSGVFDYMDNYLQDAINIKLIANVLVGTAGYHCYLREPLSADGDWKGRKIRGVATYVPVIEALGGTAVSTPMGDVYSAMERGVVDGACAPQSVFRATKHYEVAKYRTEPTFGQLVSYMGMNLDTWNDLSDAERDAVTKAAIQTEADVLEIANAAGAEDLKFLESEGVTVTTFSTDMSALVEKTYYDGLWNLVSTCCGPDTSAELRKIALDAGLTK